MSAQPARWRAVLDVVATLLTIGTCIVVVIVIIAQQRPDNSAPASRGLAVGTVLTSTKTMPFSASELTILVGLSSTCRYCTESMPALRWLAAYVQPRAERISLIALTLEPTERLRLYLDQHRVGAFRPITLERQDPLAPVAASTPQFVAVDREGRILANWSGRMTDAQMEDFVKQVVDAVPQ